MPKFTEAELEEIRKNTAEIEQRKKKSADENDDPKPKKRRSKKDQTRSLRERVFALVLLIIFISLSGFIWVVSQLK